MSDFTMHPFAKFKRPLRSALLVLWLSTNATSSLQKPQHNRYFELGSSAAIQESAGLGIELESIGFLISAVGNCSYKDMRAAKGQIVNDFHGPKWKLTADIIEHGLSLEYIIDGTAVKLGTNEVYDVAEQIERHTIEWAPKIGDEITIAGNPCKWQITEQPNELRNLWFGPQVTVPLPLEVVYDILRGAEFGRPNLHFLDHGERPGQERVVVTKEYFQSSPFGVSSDTIPPEDVLGFLSIVLSWAKGTLDFQPRSLFKGLSWILPRTDFVGLYKQVDDRLPEGRLFDFIKLLACYRNDYSGPQSTRHHVILDSRYCNGSLSHPIPLDTMDKLEFKVYRDEAVIDTLLLPEWIDGIQEKRSPDGLSIFGKKHFSPSIGGKGLQLERMFGGLKQVPLFEIRDLRAHTPRHFPRFVAEVEQGIIAYSQRYSTMNRRWRLPNDRSSRGLEGHLQPREKGSPLPDGIADLEVRYDGSTLNKRPHDMGQRHGEL